MAPRHRPRHRKPRTSALSPAARRGSIGATAAALASVTLLSQQAGADPNDDREGDRPTLEQTRSEVDALYRDAGAATQRYNAAKERTDSRRKQVDRLLDEAARRADDLNKARRVLGSYAAAQYRDGGMSDTATLLLSRDPQGYFNQTHVMERMSARQQHAVTTFRDKQRSVAKQRVAAAGKLAELTEAQRELAADKSTVQTKLTEARKLLSKLTAQERARLAAAERERQEEARKRAAAAERRAEEARKQQEQAERERREREKEKEQPAPEKPSDGGSYGAKAQKVLAFAKKELGKPYVWGATGPNSYDCSGFTQAAWRTGGLELPRTTFDQVKVGTKVAKSDMRPGDLIFFYADVTHVGIYVGGGQMIHASKPGDDVKYESVDYMPFHSAMRPT
ncbi:NlpC/P60 family protein [Streptomyces sp. XM4193]|uniref:C40 family peptidase n=1 Tax=Streptomyces sp. XM4193 TaxID=2929782 RepID=UPI001FF8DEF3|nr:C40 family peptidase [Streptomyces sp. XM4193]MCK1795517.1 NlpC/P60 family protein [Streptomyces sp. XM4193]